MVRVSLCAPVSGTSSARSAHRPPSAASAVLPGLMPPTARQLLERALGAMHGYRVPGALSAHQQAFGPVHVPVLMVAGEDDGCMAAEIFDALADATIFTRGYRIVRVPEAGHFVHHERCLPLPSSFPSAYLAPRVPMSARWPCCMRHQQ